jgi:hypothetical protein
MRLYTMFFTTLTLSALLIIGCGSSDSTDNADLPGPVYPTVISTVPADGGTTDGILTGNITATFSTEMDPATIESPALSFLLKETIGLIVVPGTVTYDGVTTTFDPTADLKADTAYTAMITTTAADLDGNTLVVVYTWNFSTVNLFPNPSPTVDLGAAGTFTVFGNTGISTVPTSVITGDIGTTSAAIALTGFSLSLDGTGVFSTSTQIVGGGKAYAFDYAVPTPTNMTNASGAIGTAYTNASGRAADVTELYSGDLSGKTLRRGVYTWTSAVHADISNVTLDGSATDIWILITSQKINFTGGARVILAGGAMAKNVFWVAADDVEIQANSHLEGIVLGEKMIILGSDATVNGRLFSQTAVTLIANPITPPAP